MAWHRRRPVLGVDQNHLQVKHAERLAGGRARHDDEERREDQRAEHRCHRSPDDRFILRGCRSSTRGFARVQEYAKLGPFQAPTSDAQERGAHAKPLTCAHPWHHRGDRGVPDATCPRTPADGCCAAGDDRSARAVGHHRGRLASPTRRPRRGASSVCVGPQRRHPHRRAAAGSRAGPVQDPPPRIASTSYRTLLRRTEPIDGSCECADFLRSSLGLCKHLVAVLEDVASMPRRLDLERGSTPEPTSVRWDPVRPLTGPGDWLARVRWVGGTPARSLRAWLHPSNGGSRAVASSAAERDASARTRRRSNREAVAETGGWTVTVPGGSPQRLVLVERLLGALQDGNGEPALYALLQQERARLAREVHNESSRARLRRALHTLKQPLYPYQHDGVERFFVRGRLLLADDMGLGKTAQAIAACHALWTTGQVRRGLLVVPAALKPQWMREWQFFTDAPARMVDGGPAQRHAAFEACRPRVPRGELRAAHSRPRDGQRLDA